MDRLTKQGEEDYIACYYLVFKLLTFILLLLNFVFQYNAAVKRALIVGISLFLSGTLFGQDLILKRNGEKIEAIILNVNKDKIQYREYPNTRGRIHKIEKPEINKIIYSSGTVWMINPLGVRKPDLVTFQKKKDKYTSGRKPVDALFYSVVLSGGGQFYNKQPVKGGVLMGFGLATITGGIISIKLDADPGIAFLCFLHYGAVKIFSIIDAPVSASRINKMYELSDGFHLKSGRINMNLAPMIYFNQDRTIAKNQTFPVYGIKLSIPLN